MPDESTKNPLYSAAYTRSSTACPHPPATAGDKSVSSEILKKKSRRQAVPEPCWKGFESQALYRPAAKRPWENGPSRRKVSLRIGYGRPCPRHGDFASVAASKGTGPRGPSTQPKVQGSQRGAIRERRGAVRERLGLLSTGAGDWGNRHGDHRGPAFGRAGWTCLRLGRPCPGPATARTGRGHGPSSAAAGDVVQAISPEHVCVIRRRKDEDRQCKAASTGEPARVSLFPAIRSRGKMQWPRPLTPTRGSSASGRS